MLDCIFLCITSCLSFYHDISCCILQEANAIWYPSKDSTSWECQCSREKTMWGLMCCVLHSCKFLQTSVGLKTVMSISYPIFITVYSWCLMQEEAIYFQLPYLIFSSHGITCFCCCPYVPPSHFCFMPRINDFQKCL